MRSNVSCLARFDIDQPRRYCYMIKSIAYGTLSILTALTAAQSHSYQFESNIKYASGEYDIDSTFDSDDTNIDFSAYNLDVTFFAQDVDTSGVPHREAAFLNKSSSGTLGYSVFELDEPDNTQSNFTAGGRWVFPEGFSVAAEFIKRELDSGDTGDTSDDTVYTLTGGYYLDDNSEFTASYSTEYNLSPVSSYSDTSYDVFSAAYKAVRELSGSNTWIGYNAGISSITASYDGDDRDGYELQAGLSFYPMTALALGANYRYASFNEPDMTVNNYDVYAEYSFTETIAANISFANASLDVDGATAGDVISIGSTSDVSMWKAGVRIRM